MKWKLLSLIIILLFVFAGVYLIFVNQQESYESNAEAESEVLPIVDKDQVSQNIAAFAKLYGYIRYFHPSDESAEFDWEGFASYGANQVRHAENPEALMNQLKSLFFPVAPTLVLTEDPSFDQAETEAAGLLQEHQGAFIFWQHRGVVTDFTEAFYGGAEDLYKSERVTFNLEDGQPVLKEPVFDHIPAEEDYIAVKKLTDEITAYFPVVLPYDEQGSAGATDESESALKALKKEVTEAKFGGTAVKSVHGRHGGIIQTWNIYQHFYPYFDVVDVNWEEQLPVFLSMAEEEQDHETYLKTLEYMLEKVDDGHSMVMSRKSPGGSTLPIRVQIIDEQIVVNEVLEGSPFKPGDVVIKKDGEAAEEVMQRLKDEISGSPQYKEALAEKKFTLGGRQTILEVNREGEVLELSAEKGSTMMESTFKEYDPVVELKEGIYYLPLYQQNVTIEQYEAYFDELERAKGIIFDLRYYPSEAALEIFDHLTEEPLPTSALNVPQYVLPDQQGEITYSENAWPLEPKTPAFGGKFIFLSDGLAISYTETLLGIAENNDLGVIVGQPSAGTNGNINGIKLMEHITIYYTGMKVLKGDGSQHHLIGIEPDVEVDYTLDAIKSGKDDYIEKALELLEDPSAVNEEI